MSVPKMQLADWLDDLSVRFIVNLPKEELESIERICFQVEEAQWFYEDFVRPTDPQLPTMNLKQFCLAFFQHCPLFADYDVDMYMQAFQTFLEYKSRVPVRGAILLNDAMDEVVLVRGWKKGANWSFPRGKINKAEDDLDCAIREVFEETGLDLQTAGLIPPGRDVKSIDVALREQSIKLFVIPNVPKDTHFQPQTRKEIGGIQWYKLSDLPTIKKLRHHQSHEGHGENLASYTNKFYMVAPFLGPLRKQIAQLRKSNLAKQLPAAQHGMMPDVPSTGVLEHQLTDASLGATLQNMKAAGGGIGDMDRLLTQLRQSKQAYREDNLPEVMQYTDPAINVSTVPPQSIAWPGAQTFIQPQPAATTPAQQNPQWVNLMPQAFQQNLQTMQGQNHLQEIRYHPGPVPQTAFDAPRTPLDMLLSQRHIPASPTHQHRPHAIHNPTMNVPPPEFAYVPAQLQRPAFEQPIIHQPVMQPGTLTVSHSASRSRSPAPYQQTGDPEFSIQSHVQGSSGPVVPEPSKLPPPKLTANSAKLLSLFRGGNPLATKPIAAAEMSADSRSQVAPTNLDSSANLLAVLQSSQQRTSMTPSPLSFAPDRAVTPALMSPMELGTTSPITGRARSTQQNALLDLFRPQSGRSLGSPSPALAPLAYPPAELAGAQSPAQAQGLSYERRAGSSEALAISNPSKGSAHKRQSGAGTVMSATVTGPLNITEKDLHRSGRRGHGSSASLSRPPGNNLVPGSVKILSRPGTSNGPNKTMESSHQSASKPTPSPRRGRNGGKQSQPSPKPFQPQILKRPVEHSGDNTTKEIRASPPQGIVAPRPMTILRRGTDYTSPPLPPATPARSTPTIDRGIVEAPSPMSRQTSGTGDIVPVSALTPGPMQASLPFDRRASQTSDQKASLLSLFGAKNTIPAQPFANITSNPVQTNIVTKPMTPAGSSQMAISPVSVLPARTRMDSVVSAASGDSLVGRQTPQATNEKDRKFLLGFLNNVANENGS